MFEDCVVWLLFEGVIGYAIKTPLQHASKRVRTLASEPSSSKQLPGLVLSGLGGPKPGSMTTLARAKAVYYPYQLDEAYGPPLQLYTPRAERVFLDYGYYF